LEVTAMRSQANSLTLYEQFQKARDDTAQFLTDAENFSKHTAKLLGTEYSKPPAPSFVKLPDLSTIEGLMGDEEVLDHSDKERDGLMVDLCRTLTSIHNSEIKMNVKEDTGIAEDEVFKTTYTPTKDGKSFKPKGEGVSDLCGTLPLAHWFVRDGKLWKPYPKDISDKLEQVWSNPTSTNSRYLEIGDIKYDLIEYKERRSIFNNNNQIRRGTWFWQEDDNSWIPYDHATAALLENASQKYGKFQLQISEKPSRIVIGPLMGTFKQLRQSQNAKAEGRVVRRGHNGQLATRNAI